MEDQFQQDILPKDQLQMQVERKNKIKTKGQV